MATVSISIAVTAFKITKLRAQTRLRGNRMSDGTRAKMRGAKQNKAPRKKCSETPNSRMRKAITRPRLITEKTNITRCRLLESEPEV